MGVSKNAETILLHFGAQCSPRHACPLRGALLMQVHEVAQAAPVLVRQGVGHSCRADEDETASSCPPLYPSAGNRTAAKSDVWAISTGVPWA